MTQILSFARRHPRAWWTTMAAIPLVVVGLCLMLARATGSDDRYLLDDTGGAIVMSINEDGDLALAGGLTQSAGAITPDSNKEEWIVRDTGGTVRALIRLDAVTGGDMWITGSLTQNTTINLAAIDEIFVVKDTGGAAVAAIDSSGDLYLKGALSENADNPSSLSAPTDMDCEIDYNADLYLTWTDNSSYEEGYQIYRGASAASQSYYASVGEDVDFYVDSSAAENELYYYKVRAYKSATYSDYSGVVAGLALDLAKCDSP